MPLPGSKSVPSSSSSVHPQPHTHTHTHSHSHSQPPGPTTRGALGVHGATLSNGRHHGHQHMHHPSRLPPPQHAVHPQRVQRTQSNNARAASHLATAPMG